MAHTREKIERDRCANESEKRVFDRLKRLERQGAITSFRHAHDTPQKGESVSEEARKIDFVITLWKETIYLQVKESDERAANHATEHPNIPCVIVRPDPAEMTDGEIDRKILTALKRTFEGQKGICL
ncbi:MAG: hypothetical protein Q8Q39_06065 [bacterium]|nr:hypothetical protein [bacterium]